ncbi:unnamed protein product [Parajaminaea phylloscopi]
MSDELQVQPAAGPAEAAQNVTEETATGDAAKDTLPVATAREDAAQKGSQETQGSPSPQAEEAAAEPQSPSLSEARQPEQAAPVSTELGSRQKDELQTEEVNSRKRDREGSVEPSAAAEPSSKGLSTPDTLPTKKNRLIEEESPEDVARDNEKVGQIRRRVEELSYDERDSKRAGSSVAADLRQSSKGADEQKAVAGSAATPSRKGPPTSTATKPTPSSQRTQPTFASFSASSSPFASSSASSSVAGPSWLAGSGSSSPSPFGSALTHSPKVGGMSGTTGALKPSALGGETSTASSTSENGRTTDTSRGGAEPAAKAAEKKASTPAPAPAAGKSGGSLGFGAFAASKAFAASTTSSSLATPSPTHNSDAQNGDGETPQVQSIFDRQASESDADGSEADRVNAVGASEDQDDATKIKVQRKDEAELATGEEHERTVHSVRAKLYTMSQQGTKDGSWKERGTGTLRVNVPSDYRLRGSGARLVMRAEGVLRLILNVALFSGMSVESAQDKFIRFVAMEDGKLQHFAVRVSNAAAASTLVSTIRHYIPAAGGSAAKTASATAKQAGGGPSAPMSKATAVVFKDAEEQA